VRAAAVEVFQKELPVVPDRRTITVLGSLVAGMTVISGLLLVLQPGPVTPLSGVTLQAIDRSALQSPANRVFETAEPRAWEGLVIHDSGAAQGSAKTLGRLHRQLGRSGLGYHFVINNGSLKPDGLIEMSRRWREQQPGHYFTGDSARTDQFHQQYVGVSLIGNGDESSFTRAQMQELVWLARQLQQRHDIPKNEIYVDISRADQQAGTFPHAWFRKQLLNVAPTRTAKR